MYSDSQTPTEQTLGFSLDIPAKRISGYGTGAMVMDAKMEGKGIAKEPGVGEKQVDSRALGKEPGTTCPLPVSSSSQDILWLWVAVCVCR